MKQMFTFVASSALYSLQDNNVLLSVAFICARLLRLITVDDSLIVSCGKTGAFNVVDVSVALSRGIIPNEFLVNEARGKCICPKIYSCI